INRTTPCSSIAGFQLHDAVPFAPCPLRPPPVRAASPGGPPGRHLPRTAHLHLQRTAGAVQVGAGDGPPAPLRAAPLWGSACDDSPRVSAKAERGMKV